MIGETLGQFRILEVIGAGGMGVVYRAHDERLDRDVALKVLPAGTLTDEAMRRRFRQEALALSRLNHPSIATVHDFNSQGKVDFLVMEWIPGQTLDARIGGEPLPEREILRLAMQLVQGLEAAHQQGVIHRDLKPGNLRITPDERLKILDFGLAMLRQAEMTDAARTTELGEQPLVAGSPPYMAPEQLLGEKVDGRSDLYGAGAVMYEMATGRRPWPQAQGARLIDAILHLLPLPPRELNARLTPGLEALILKCLDKDPGRRYQSARELIVDLERLSVPSAVTAPQPRPARRSTWAATVAAVALLAVLLGSGPGGARARVNTEPIGPIHSLAVLPLENQSHDGAQEYFVDGMTDALIAELGQISSLEVISRTSSMQYKAARKPLPEIARELGVDAVLEGAVLRAGDQVRITAQLVHAPSDRQLWGRTYVGDLRDVITLQRQVASSVATEVRAKLTAQERTRLATPRPVNPEAYEAHLRGWHLFQTGEEKSLEKALAYFTEAAAKDPGYAPAQVGIAEVHTVLAHSYRRQPQERLQWAQAALKRALDLDPALAEGHRSRAWVGFVLDWDWPLAEREFELALQSNPNDARAHELRSWFLTAQGRLEEALTEMKRAKELDPLSPLINHGLGGVYMYRGQIPEAIQTAQRNLELQPRFFVAHYALGRCYMIQSKHKEAIAEFEKAISLSPAAAIQADLAHAYALSGQRAKAVAALKRWEDSAGSSARSEQAAMVHAALGAHDKAFSLLEQAYNDRSPGLLWLKVDPRFESLRGDARYKSLLQKLRLAS